MGLVPDLYAKLGMCVASTHDSFSTNFHCSPEEIVTPHQTTLLKLLDSHLQCTPISSPVTKSKMTKTHAKLCPMLAHLFFSLSFYGQTAIRKSLHSFAPDSSSDLGGSYDGLTAPTELDVMLPKVCEALVLVTQCIVTITLDARSQHQHHHNGSPNSGSSTSSNEDLQLFFNQVHHEGVGMVETLAGLFSVCHLKIELFTESFKHVDLLRLVDRFLPRINFGKPISTVRSADTALEGQQRTESQPPAPVIDHPGFNFLKRDLVRLLGILCNEDKAVQDRLRKCGGIEVVMNLCVIDERNPCELPDLRMI